LDRAGPSCGPPLPWLLCIRVFSQRVGPGLAILADPVQASFSFLNKKKDVALKRIFSAVDGAGARAGAGAGRRGRCNAVAQQNFAPRRPLGERAPDSHRRISTAQR
jgi:hypothetical protein